MKYVIGRCRGTGMFYPIVFANEVVHAEAARALPATCELLGAGECRFVKNVGFEATGFSSSLQLGPSEIDAQILSLFLTIGLSGLQLQNQITLIQLERAAR